MDILMTFLKVFRTIFLVVIVLSVTTTAVAQTPVTFESSFLPATIGPGSVSTLEFVVTNSDLVNPAVALAFTNVLPGAVTIADPANAVSTCGGSLSAPAGGATIALTDGGVGTADSCIISVDVTSTTVGTHTNTSGELTSSAGNSGTASADLTIAVDRPGFRKAFSPATVLFGGRSTLTFEIDNTLNSAGAANLTFTDNMPFGMVVADPSNVSTTCGSSVATAVPGSSVVSFAPASYFGGTVDALAICAVSVDIIGGAVGSLGNSTGELTSTPPAPFGGPIRSSGKANASLTVTSDEITLTKSFLEDPVAPGTTVTLQFTVRNLNRRSNAANIAFSDDLNATVAGLQAVGLPLVDPCGGGSSLTGTSVLSLTGGNLGPEGVCTFGVVLQVPAGVAAGAYQNTTSEITADIDGIAETGEPASDYLFVQPVPRLSKTFLDNPVGAGGTAELEFTITNTSAVSAATDITFEDVFEVELPTASVIPAADFCGAGSTATYTPLIDFGAGGNPAKLVVAGANLGPGASCTFSITLDVAVGAGAGAYGNTTSAITATVDGQTFAGNPASDTLNIVAAPTLYKEFIDDPVAPGDTVTLRFTLVHDENAPGDATDISFSDDLTFLTGLSAVGLPLTDPCGAGSAVTGSTNLSFSGGTLTPGETCTFSVSLQVPAAATPGSYTNTTTEVSATVLGLSASEYSASDVLKIAGLNLTKEFIDDPVRPGDTVTLRFTVNNTSPTFAATEILFFDDLDDVVSGLAATDTFPKADVCGAGSSLAAGSGNTLIFLQNGNLAAGGSCTFDVVLTVPVGTAADSYANLTSSFSATVDGETVEFDNASDVLVVASDFLSLTKEFTDDPVAPGTTANLRFTLSNLDPAEAASEIAFTDDLDAVITGLASSSGSLNGVCGLGSVISGADTLVFSGGSLAAGASCTFDVALAIPADVSLGTVATNVTSGVTGMIGGLPVTGQPAVDNLHISVLTFEKSFGGDANEGGTAGLTFTIRNFDAVNTVADLEFSDDLDAVLSGLAAIGTPLADVCGVGSLLSGSSVLTLTGASVPPGDSCTFSVDLQVPAGASPGDYLNVTSFLWQDGFPVAERATATLSVVAVVEEDNDNDGVLDSEDDCLGTVIPEGVPTKRLGVNRFALVDDDLVFDTTSPHGQGPKDVFTTTETRGCSCEQIIEILDLGKGHTKFGCSVGVMRFWSYEMDCAEDFIFYSDFDDEDTLAWSSSIQ